MSHGGRRVYIINIRRVFDLVSQGADYAVVGLKQSIHGSSEVGILSEGGGRILRKTDELKKQPGKSHLGCSREGFSIEECITEGCPKDRWIDKLLDKPLQELSVLDAGNVGVVHQELEHGRNVLVHEGHRYVVPECRLKGGHPAGA